MGGVVVGEGKITFIHGHWESPCMVLKKPKARTHILMTFLKFQKPMYYFTAHVSYVTIMYV